MRTTWRIRLDMRNGGYNFPDWVRKTSYQCNYTPDRDFNLSYWGWQIESHTKFSKLQCLMMICTIAPLLVLNSTITEEHEVNWSLSISPCYNQELTPSTAYAEYSTYSVLHTPHTAASQNWLSPAPSQFLSSQLIMLYSVLHNPTITS